MGFGALLLKSLQTRACKPVAQQCIAEPRLDPSEHSTKALKRHTNTGKQFMQYTHTRDIHAHRDEKKTVAQGALGLALGALGVKQFRH